MGLRDSRRFLFGSLLWGVFSSHLFDHTIWLQLSAPNHFYLVNVTSQHLQRDMCSCEDRFEDNCCCDQQCDLTILYFHLTLCQVNTQPLIFEAHFHIHAESQHNELEMLKALHKYRVLHSAPRGAKFWIHAIFWQSAHSFKTTLINLIEWTTGKNASI